VPHNNTGWVRDGYSRRQHRSSGDSGWYFGMPVISLEINFPVGKATLLPGDPR